MYNVNMELGKRPVEEVGWHERRLSRDSVATPEQIALRALIDTVYAKSDKRLFLMWSAELGLPEEND